MERAQLPKGSQKKKNKTKSALLKVPESTVASIILTMVEV